MSSTSLLLLALIQVAGAELLALSVSSSSPGQLDVLWGSPALSAGASGAAETSCGVLDAWQLLVTSSGVSTEVDVEANCDQPVPGRQGHTCQLTLTSNTSYDVEVLESCNDTQARDPSNASIFVMGQPASPPSVSVTDVSETSISASWSTVANGDCIFERWQVDWRPYGSTWQQVENGTGTSVQMTGLQGNAPYELRVEQVCTDTKLNSVTQTEEGLFTLPGIFSEYVGTSSDTKVLQLSYTPSRCKTIKECCGDQIVVCLSGSDRKTATLTRMEVPGGWGQQIWLQCTAASVEAFTTFTEVQAPAPQWLQLHEATKNTMKAKYQLGWIVGETTTCECAEVSLELSGDGVVWTRFRGHADSCTLIGTRDCFLDHVMPDTRYMGRMKMLCGNSSADSDYTYTQDAIITPPGCIWSTHTGQWDQGTMFECADGTYCSEADPACCVAHGGRIRCPESTPYMCQNTLDCANSQERCCMATEEECNGHGGLRTCEVPAKTPLLTQVESLGPASLTISWEPQEYLIGYSSCQFLEWRVAISQVHIYGEGEWRWIESCNSRNYDQRTCTIENLLSLTNYNVQVWAQCTVVELSSYPNRTTVAVETRPIPSGSPSALFCTQLEPLRFYADWWPSPGEDCIFVAWQLDAQLLPRTAGFTADGLYEEAAVGGDWETKCLLYDQAAVECWVEDLLANRDYKIRVRETCTDPLANSPFFERYQECTTLTMPAFDPQNLSAYNEDLYTFEASWEPNDPKACIFQYWDVQAKVNGTDWPEGDDPPVFGCRVLERTSTNCTVHVGINSGSAFQWRIREACTVRRLFTNWVYYDGVVETRLPVPASQPQNLSAYSMSPSHEISYTSLIVSWDALPPGECIFTGWKVETSIHGQAADWQESSECRANARLPFACSITTGLLSNVYYDMRISETCVDPNAEGEALMVYNIARTRPVPAVAPVLVSVYATSARSLGVTFTPQSAGQCVFKGYAMEWQLQGWDYWQPDDACTPRNAALCTVDGFPASQSFYTVRLMETCTDPLADSPWVEWPEFIQTWPEPAQAPSNFTLPELTAYNVTFTFEPGLGLDCTWSSWQAQMLLDVSGSAVWTDLTECDSQLQFRENITCSVLGLESNTRYQVRVRERCTIFIYDSDWGYSELFYSSMPIQAALPQDFHLVTDSVTAFFFDVSWTAGAAGQCIFKEWVMEVYQVSPDPDSWAFPPLVELLDAPQTWVRHSCGASREAPLCRAGDLPRSLKQNSSYSVRVKESCTDPNADSDFMVLATNVTTIVALIPAEPPQNLTVSNETAYSFLLEFDAGDPKDCYFTGWGVEVRENYTFDANFSNDSNYTELNYSLWVPREECKEEDTFPRHRMRCVVPRLRKHSIYDAKVRETCYVGYTFALDSGFSTELPDRQAETEVPEAATTPFGLEASQFNPYSFRLQWSPGDPQDCLYMKWLVEILDENFTGGEWREAAECGREDRSVTSCTITQLDAGYLGDEAHLRSNTEYQVRVREACETYTSIYDPWGGDRERAEYLDSPIHYLPLNALARTLVPVPTTTPTNFQVYDIDHQSFRLSWEAPISNDCRFRNWTVEIQRVVQCVSGPGYTNCTEVADDPWIIPSSCVIKDRAITTCQVQGVTSYAFYNVRMRERCSDATAESTDASLVAEIWPFLADVPENLTVSSPGPFSLKLQWDPGHDQECVFSHWDVQVQGRRYGDLEDPFSRESVAEKWYGEIFDLENYTLNWSSTISSCRLEGQREVAECSITGLVSNALYDVRIAERCVDSRADSIWLVQRLRATIPAWALTPLGPNVSNITTTSMDLEWAASEPRDCLFQSWKVEVKPVAITYDAWILVPECSLPERNATSCHIVGLQSYTSYDLRVQETCIHNTSDSPYLLDESSFTTDVGRVVYVGSNPSSNSKAIQFGTLTLNACAYHTKCCQDEFSLCYGSDQVEVIRTDLPDAGWGQDLYLSCVEDSAAQDDMKRVVAQPPATLQAIERTANSITLLWLPFGSGGYMSDCYCSVWNIFLRRQGTTEWLLSPECNTMPFQQSSCTVKELEGNWLTPDTIYEIRVRQTCSFDRLSSPFVEIQAPTLPGCSFSQHSGREDFFVCADGFESNIFEGGRFDGDGIGCWQRGGRAKCAMNFPYMCASPDSCAKVTSAVQGGVRADHCCMTEPCGSRNGGDRVCIVRPNPPTSIVVSSSTPDSLYIDWQEQDFADPTFYPCSFRRWQVDLSRFYFEHWSSEWTPAPECFIEVRRSSSCTVTGLVSNALYYIRIREVCEDDSLNGDYESYPTLAQVNPLPAEAATGLYDVQREPFWIHVAWTAGNPNDCVHAAWRIMAVAGMESHVFTTDGQRENAFFNMSGLTDGTTYEVSLQEKCENELANSELASIFISSKPAPAGAPAQPTVAAAGPYWLSIEWQDDPSGRCEFRHWDVQARKTGAEPYETAVVCTEQLESETYCNVTETFSCYKDKTYAGFFDVCIPGVECPMTDIVNVTACQLACSLQPACRALRFQAAYSHCYLIDSSGIQLDDDPIHETTGCARNLGLESLAGYQLEVAKRCEDPEADSSFVRILPGLANNETTIGHATQPEDVAVQAVAGVSIRLSFAAGPVRDFMPIRVAGPRLEMDDTTDCVFQQWSVQVMLNKSEAPSDGPVPCWQYPFACEQMWHTVPSTCADELRATAWCEAKVYWSQELYQLRMREECADPAANSPYTADPAWVESGVATAAERVENFTAVASIIDYNISVTFHWDASEDNDCIFTGWELQLREMGEDWQLLPCIDANKDDVNCTVTEGLRSQTTYDARVRAFCLDPLTKGNWTEKMLRTPIIPADAPLLGLLSMGPQQMWFSLEPQEPRDCAFMGYTSEFQALGMEVVSSSSLDDESDLQTVNETQLCLPRQREDAECMLQGLSSNTTYRVRICELCENPEASSCAEAINTTGLLPAEAPRIVMVSREMEYAMVRFIAGEENDCRSSGWLIQYFNASWLHLDDCPLLPGTEQQCSLRTSGLPETSLWLRVSAACADELLSWANFSLPALEALDDREVSNMSNMSNSSGMEEEEAKDMEMDMNDMNVTFMANSSNVSDFEGNEMDEWKNQTRSNLSQFPAENDSWMLGNMSREMDNQSAHSNQSMSAAWNGTDEDLEDLENETNDSAYFENSSGNSSANASENISMDMDEGVQDALVGAQSRMSCQDSADCSWILGDWSSCSNGCGAGTQTRSVDCQSGYVEDCPKPMPESSSSCYSTQLCSWVASPGECNTRCGAGTQIQSWSCPSGNAADCGDEPAAEAACYATSGCVWITPDWSNCSSSCGYGTRERNVSCSGITEADCGRARPAGSEICHEISGCIWRLGEWGACSASCGDGFRLREVFCPSGAESDCGLKPSTVEACREVSSCQWLVSPWSVCSSSCGNGWINRTVSCESGLQADCAQPEPSSHESCFESFCNWTVSDWSACNVTCGSGFQEREASCPGGCEGQPPTVQACVGRSCTWELGNWSACSSSCGTGIRNRSLSCPSEYVEDCSQAPVSYELCTSYSGCSWQVGEWSACDGCGQRIRAVYCQSGDDEDCAADRPGNVTTCDLEACTEATGDSASFDLVVEVGSEEDVEQIKGSTQEAVAESLNVDVNDVSVTPVVSGRRLATQLKFLVEIQKVPKSVQEFLSSESGRQVVANGVVQELVSTGIQAVVQITARAETTTEAMTSTAAPTSSSPPSSLTAVTTVTTVTTVATATTVTTVATVTTSTSQATEAAAQATQASSSQGGSAAAPTTTVATPDLQVKAEAQAAQSAQPSALWPILGISLVVLAVFGALLWRGRRRQLKARATKGAWPSEMQIQQMSKPLQAYVYPWDYAADTLAAMIWKSSKVQTSTEEIADQNQSPTNCRVSSVAQSPHPAPSEPSSLANSFGSEAGQAVAAAASQVRGLAAAPRIAAQIAQPVPPPVSPPLRVAAEAREAREAREGRVEVAGRVVSSMTRPPDALGAPPVRVSPVRVRRREEGAAQPSQLPIPGAMAEKERKDSWEASRTPVSQSPRDDSEPQSRIPRRVHAVAHVPTSPSDSERRRSNSARRVAARPRPMGPGPGPSDCWPPPQPR